MALPFSFERPILIIERFYCENIRSTHIFLWIALLAGADDDKMHRRKEEETSADVSGFLQKERKTRLHLSKSYRTETEKEQDKIVCVFIYICRDIYVSASQVRYKIEWKHVLKLFYLQERSLNNALFDTLEPLTKKFARTLRGCISWRWQRRWCFALRIEPFARSHSGQSSVDCACVCRGCTSVVQT